MGEISKHTKMTQSGTIVIVKDLFYKVINRTMVSLHKFTIVIWLPQYPVRRRQASTPYQYVVMMESVKRLLTMYALCFPCIQFTLIDGTRDTRVLSLKKVIFFTVDGIMCLFPLQTSSSIDTFRQIAGPEIIKVRLTPIYVQSNLTKHSISSPQRCTRIILTSMVSFLRMVI